MVGKTLSGGLIFSVGSLIFQIIVIKSVNSAITLDTTVYRFMVIKLELYRTKAKSVFSYHEPFRTQKGSIKRFFVGINRNVSVFRTVLFTIKSDGKTLLCYLQYSSRVFTKKTEYGRLIGGVRFALKKQKRKKGHGAVNTFLEKRLLRYMVILRLRFSKSVIRFLLRLVINGTVRHVMKV